MFVQKKSLRDLLFLESLTVQVANTIDTQEETTQITCSVVADFSICGARDKECGGRGNIGEEGRIRGRFPAIRTNKGSSAIRPTGFAGDDHMENYAFMVLLFYPKFSTAQESIFTAKSAKLAKFKGFFSVLCGLRGPNVRWQNPKYNHQFELSRALRA